MASTYEPIASTTLGSAASSVTLSSIPSTFTDLVLICHSSTSNATFSGIRWQFNGDTGSNYSTTRLYGTGSAAGSARVSNDTEGIARLVHDAGNLTPNILHIMSYANTNVYKTVLAIGASNAYHVARNVSLWRSTAAISSIYIYDANAVNIDAGSTFSLFGIKAA